MSASQDAKFQSYVICKGHPAKTAVQVTKMIKGVADAAKGLQERDLTKVVGGATSAAGNGADAMALRMTGLFFGEISKSMSMGKALHMTPGKASLYISVVVMDKTLKAAGVADIKEFTACQRALASLATDLALGILAVPTGWGAPLAVLAIGFSAYEMSNQCIVPRMR